jgi:hypothetical protein
LLHGGFVAQIPETGLRAFDQTRDQVQIKVTFDEKDPELLLLQQSFGFLLLVRRGRKSY